MTETNKKFYVMVGLGKTGLACVQFLLRQGFNVAVTDSRDQPPGLDMLQQQFPDVEVVTGGFSAELLNRADEIILSQGVPATDPQVVAQRDRGVSIISDIELFARFVDAPVVAITGSNGKTTVTTLLGEMVANADLRVKVGGNIGVVAVDLLTETKPDCYVLEVSNFQLELTDTLRPKVAVFLNYSPDHLDRYASAEDYLKAKQRVYHGCEIAVINRDDPVCWRGVVSTGKTISFGLSQPDVDQFGLLSQANQNYLALGQQPLLAVSELKVKGKHQQANALAALALGQALGLPLASMLTTLKNFAGLQHRSQWLAKVNGVDWYNDSKGTNVGATVAAIEGLGSEIQGKIVLLAGGLGKNADFSPLEQPVKNYTRQVILFGKDAAKIAAVVQEVTEITLVENLVEAVAIAKKVAQPGDVVLLSPACASFDMFANFEHRGQVFSELVNQLFTITPRQVAGTDRRWGFSRGAKSSP